LRHPPDVVVDWPLAIADAPSSAGRANTLHSCRYAPPPAAHLVLCDSRRGSLVTMRPVSGLRSDRDQHCHGP
jgi:hypothetical protein